jgi:hypothetical protein
VFADEELERLRGFPEIAADNLFVRLAWQLHLAALRCCWNRLRRCCSVSTCRRVYVSRPQ